MALHKRQAVSHSPGREVMLMWDEPRKKFLRFVVCLVFLIYILTIKAR
nr:MAG TPA: hypothetical protein [Caudoviricetes sp.]